MTVFGGHAPSFLQIPFFPVPFLERGTSETHPLKLAAQKHKSPNSGLMRLVLHGLVIACSCWAIIFSLPYSAGVTVSGFFTQWQMVAALCLAWGEAYPIKPTT